MIDFSPLMDHKFESNIDQLDYVATLAPVLALKHFVKKNFASLLENFMIFFLFAQHFTFETCPKSSRSAIHFFHFFLVKISISGKEQPHFSVP
jgi:hypothetical protein